jgi:hypothetical protein
MRTYMILVVGLALVACGKSTGGAGGAGGTGVGGHQTCPGECCPQPPYLCAGLDEAACGAAEPGCWPVKGKPFGSAASIEVHYVGCSSCQVGGSYETCVVDPAHPDTCVFVYSELVPDGWTEVFECGGCVDAGPADGG